MGVPGHGCDRAEPNRDKRVSGLSRWPVTSPDSTSARQLRALASELETLPIEAILSAEGWCR
jgi:hypothetical protein